VLGAKVDFEPAERIKAELASGNFGSIKKQHSFDGVECIDVIYMYMKEKDDEDN
jgi:hypothetical protein